MGFWQMVSGFPRFYFTSRTWRAIHSPYLFKFSRFVFDTDRHYSAFADIEQVRQSLLDDPSPIRFRDMGASGTKESTQSTVRAVAARSLSSAAQCQVRFRTAVYLEAGNILELGASLGVSTAYLAAASSKASVTAIDASESHLGYARGVAKTLELDNIRFLQGTFDDVLPDVLSQAGPFDLVIIDGNHRAEATIRYLDMLLPSLTPNAVVLVDDIRWSAGMQKAWKTIRQRPGVTASMDLYKYGMLFFRDEFLEPLHMRVLTSRKKPWEMW